jgi:hypothetical protein
MAKPVSTKGSTSDLLAGPARRLVLVMVVDGVEGRGVHAPGDQQRRHRRGVGVRPTDAFGIGAGAACDFREVEPVAVAWCDRDALALQALERW